MAIGAKAATQAPAANPAAPKRAAGRPAAAAAKPQSSPVQAQLNTQTAGVNFVSLNPESFGQGGLIDDIDVEITDALAVTWDYNGNAPMGPALAVEFTDVNGGQHIQYFSAGKAEDWQAHESGEGFMPVSGKTGFNNNSNIAMFLDSLVTAGFPKEHMTGNVKVFIGTKCHVIQKVTERKGLIRTGKNADRPSSVLIVSKIHQLPAGVGAQGALQQAAASPVQTQTATVGGHVNGAAAGNDLDAELQGYLIAALAENPVIEKKDIVKIVFKAATEAGKAAADRNKAVIRAGQQDFLSGLAGVGISYTGTEISLAG